MQADQLLQENGALELRGKNPYQRDGIQGHSLAWRRVIETVTAVAGSNATILILGESGTGKELIAEAIHQCSQRAHGPLVKVHCAALPENLLESELFGHEKGAFTGATSLRKGRLEEAHGGTLFLDEVGDIPLPAQVKLLRVLQEKTFERLGNNVVRRTDFRLLAATHRDLRAEVKAGHFREDLFYRLNVIPLILPPLRERKDDIPILAEHFLRKSNANNHKNIQGIAQDVLDCLKQYTFPGNIRELENLIEHGVVLCHSICLRMEDLPDYIRYPATAKKTDSDGPLEKLWRGEWSLDTLEEYLIKEAMGRTHGIQTKAASLLGISRRTLQYRLEKYGLLTRPASNRNFSNETFNLPLSKRDVFKEYE